MSTATFKFLKRLHFIADEEKYGDITVMGFILHIFKTILILLLLKYCYSSLILEPLNFKFIRAKFWRFIGCHVGKNVKIGHSVILDYGNANLITIGNNVSITDGCILLCHRKDISNYKKGDDSSKLPFIHAPIILEDGVNLGKGSIIMPGVKIGKGSVIGAGSVVTKDIPCWSVVVGVPAKVIRKLE